jgi:hypothetical protein
MAKAKQQDRAGQLIKEVEALARRMQADIRKRVKASGLLKNLQSTANQLRKRAAQAAGQVEKYVHELRKELESGSRPPKRKAAKRPKRRKRPVVEQSVTTM